MYGGEEIFLGYSDKNFDQCNYQAICKDGSIFIIEIGNLKYQDW